MDPVADARALVSERFPTALAAFLGGGVLSDRRTPTSDLDIVVIVGVLPAPYRESMTWRNWPAELFVHQPDTVGEIVDTGGHVMGEHGGVHHFTVGQRRGLGIAAREPLYVIATEPATQRVIVGRNDDLLRASMVAKDVNWISVAPTAEPVRAEVKIRNKHLAAHAMLYPTSDPARIDVRFDEPQRAVTPGQAAVFYDSDLVLGGGWIVK